MTSFNPVETVIAKSGNKEFRTKVPTHFVRNSISNINVRKDREFLLVSNNIRGGSRVGQRMSVIR